MENIPSVVIDELLSHFVDTENPSDSHFETPPIPETIKCQLILLVHVISDSVFDDTGPKFSVI